MKSLRGKEFCKILERFGWILLRIKGSHHIYSNPEGKIKIIVPVNSGKDLKVGLLKHLMKLANITEKDLS